MQFGKNNYKLTSSRIGVTGNVSDLPSFYVAPSYSFDPITGVIKLVNASRTSGMIDLSSYVCFESDYDTSTKQCNSMWQNLDSQYATYGVLLYTVEAIS